MKKKVKFVFDPGYVGTRQEEIMEYEFDDGTSENEIDQEIDRDLRFWLDEHATLYWEPIDD